MQRPFALSLAILLGLCWTALSHEGNWYEYACCGHSGDCRPVKHHEIVRNGEGWKFVPLNVHFSADQFKPSRDHRNHVCVYQTSSGWRGRCIYLAPGL